MRIVKFAVSLLKITTGLTLLKKFDENAILLGK